MQQETFCHTSSLKNIGHSNKTKELGDEWYQVIMLEAASWT
jgi:hypothetical protein